MIVRKYTSDTETGAVLLAKEELGPNAVVLNVKNMRHRGFAKLFKKDFVEITAALEERDFATNVSQKKPVVQESPVVTDYTSKIDFRVQEVPSHQGHTSEIEHKLDSLNVLLRNQMNKEVEEQQEESGMKPMNSNTNTVNFKSLRLIYNKLLENEVDEKYANAIINDIENSLKKESTLDSILASVYQKLILKLGEPEVIRVVDKKKVVFFIGPTGVGKTTTIAKLASDFKIAQNKKIALITADTYRIAAVEQLNTYASILDVPVNVVYTPSEIADNIRELLKYDMIFIDTAGRSHKNEEQKNEIMEMIETVKKSDLDVDIEVFVVLSVTTKYKDLIEIADTYKNLDRFRLLFTKLDETGSLGNILNLKCHTDAPLSYTTCGQNVPDDIETVDVQKLAKKLLGGD